MIFKKKLKFLAAVVTVAVYPCLMAMEASAQQPARATSAQSTEKVTVSGTVVDESGVPVIGASIMVDGKLSYGGVVSDLDGRFTFKCPSGLRLSISCIGYQSAYITARQASNIVIRLQEDQQVLADAVVVGYGVQEKESVLGAISQVSTEKLVNSGTTNITNALAGKLSGVQTFQTSGQPGAASNATITIRGISSWNGDAPLVMVDGIERDFSSIDPNEVATISVLKDASATAVYGSKGANGVILVTTRSGVEGRPTMYINVDTGIGIPTKLPRRISAYETGLYANEAMRNVRSFNNQFTDKILGEYLQPSSIINAVRYPDNDWYDLLCDDFSSTTNANFNISGGQKRVKYFVSVGYTHEGSMIKILDDRGNAKFTYDRLNYRSNVDVDVTPTTKLSLKIGGTSGITQKPTGTDTVKLLFKLMYNASPMMYPAYFPAYMLDLFPDPASPGASGIRITNASSGEYAGIAGWSNPMEKLLQGDFKQTTATTLFTDLVFSQDLKMITPGLRFDAKASLTSSFDRESLSATTNYQVYRFDWAQYDMGNLDSVWSSNNSSGDIVVIPPYKMTQSNTPQNQAFQFYWEAALNYSRKFNKTHSVTGLVLMNQKEYYYKTNFPKKNMAYVARGTYDYRKKYLLELNMGYTGSEQFAPANRFGFFPSAAVGYVLSKEDFWSKSMPWWSKFKIRYSDGIVGSDSSAYQWLYYSSFSKKSGYIYEDSAANETARWETAHKRDLGIELGWFKDKLTLNIDLFDEHRKDMLITPIVTTFVGVDSKAVNRAGIKKHGIDMELSYKNTTPSRLYYEVGAMLGLNENRITRYEDPAYAPQYQKTAGTAYKSQTQGMDLIGNGYFNSIDEIHLLPSYSSDWTSVFPGAFKYVDYTADGKITSDDLHAIHGSAYSPCTYSFNAGLSYKGFTFNILFYGNYGKYINFNYQYHQEFAKGNYLIHEAALDHWTPTNHDASHPALGFDNDIMLSWAGGNASDGYELWIDGQTWKRSDYLTLKEVYLGYRIDSKWMEEHIGIKGATVSLTGNNLFMLTNLIDGDPQLIDLGNGYYPIMTTIKFGLKFSF